MCNCAVTPNFPRCEDGSRGACKLGHRADDLRPTPPTVDALCALATYHGPAYFAEAVKLARQEAS